MSGRLLFVGSIPCDTVEEVYRVWGQELRNALAYMPDGEVGDRLHWIDGQAFHVFNGHPDIDTLKRPLPDDGVERWKPRDLEDQWHFEVKPGVELVQFADPGWRLGYARDAINSYFVFKTLKKEGVLPQHLRMMVALPTPESATVLYFHDPKRWSAIKPGYEAAMLAEVATIIDHILAEDLAIQWDAACESVDIEFGLPWLGTITPERYSAYVNQFERLSAPIPESVALGYHACFGTLGGWPVVSPDTLANEVKFLNDAVAVSSRKVDFVHLPMLERTELEYAEPLADLNVAGAQVYLGMIHNMDTFQERLANARHYLSEFSIAAPCGFGRIPADVLQKRFDQHKKALEIFSI